MKVAALPSKRLPASLLIEIGRIATTWAYIEQELILWTSALAAQDTGGVPEEHLRTDFKRLREKWYSLARAKLDRNLVDKVLHPINSQLSRDAIWRGYVIHGRWRTFGRGKYKLLIWEQKEGKGLELLEFDPTLAELRALADRSLSLLGRLEKAARGQPGA
jgi:hypothetical protein